VSAVLAGSAHGIGFALTDSDYAAIDLDKCRDPETGRIDAWAQDIIDRAPGAYVEATVSGTGLRVIGVAVGSEAHRKFTVSGEAAVEVYRKATRYITISCAQIGDCAELTNIDALIDYVIETYGQPKSNGAAPLFDIDDLIENGTDGDRSAAFSKVVWSLAGQGYTQEEIEQELRSSPIAEKYLKPRDRLAAEINRCYEKWKQAQAQPGSKARQQTHDWDDPDSSILEDRRGDLPAFPLDALTEPWQELLPRVANNAGVSIEHLVTPLFGVASSLIGCARKVRTARGWSEPMALWTVLVAASGERKTPAFRAITGALDLIERNSTAAVSAKRLKHETIAQSAREAVKKWKADREEAIKAGQQPPTMPSEALEPGNFIEPRLYVTDPTIERLAALLCARPRGMLLVRDELSGLFANMSRYSGGSDRPFWLGAWDSNRHVVERVSGPIVVPHLMIGVVGGFQPDKLQRAFAGDEDGMHARFLYAWPQSPGYRPLSNEANDVEPELVNALTALVRLPCEDDADLFAPQTVWLSDDAITEFEEYRGWNDQEKRRVYDLERQWFSKGETVVLRLAGTLAYMAWAIKVGTVSGIGGIIRSMEPTKIEREFVSAAVRIWRDFFWPHAQAALRQIGMNDRRRNERRALLWIQSRGAEQVSREDIRRDALHQKLDAEETQKAIDALVKAGWLRETTVPTGAKGKPARRWAVNPKLHAQAA
jgi:hypothetical protein